MKGIIHTCECTNKHACMPSLCCTLQTLVFLSDTWGVTQPFVLALMMGTHSRLGAGSPLRLLDDLIAASIAQSLIADSW